MIGIFFRSDATQVVLGKKQKKGIFIQECLTLPSVLDAVKQGDSEHIGQLFLDVLDRFHLKNDEFYLSLPDELFTIDCFPYEYDLRSEEVPIVHMSQFLHADLEKFNVMEVMEFRKKNNKMVTACALEKKVVQAIAEAAMKTDILLFHLEAASLSFLRFIDDWSHEVYILEVFDTASSFVSFSPAAGLYKIPLPEFTWEKLGAVEEETVNAILLQMIARNDAMAERTFGIANVDIPIHVISPYSKRLMALPALETRLAALQPATYIQYDSKKVVFDTKHVVSVGVLCEAVMDNANQKVK